MSRNLLNLLSHRSCNCKCNTNSNNKCDNTEYNSIANHLISCSRCFFRTDKPNKCPSCNSILRCYYMYLFTINVFIKWKCFIIIILCKTFNCTPAIQSWYWICYILVIIIINKYITIFICKDNKSCIKKSDTLYKICNLRKINMHTHSTIIRSVWMLNFLWNSNYCLIKILAVIWLWKISINAVSCLKTFTICVPYFLSSVYTILKTTLTKCLTSLWVIFSPTCNLKISISSKERSFCTISNLNWCNKRISYCLNIIT